MTAVAPPRILPSFREDRSSHARSLELMNDVYGVGGGETETEGDLRSVFVGVLPAPVEI